MKLWKKILVLAMTFSLMMVNSAFAATNKESNLEDDSDVIIIDEIISEDEYIAVVAKSENLTCEEAKELIANDREIARVAPESVVTIHRTVTKKVNNDFSLQCSAYLDVVRDNRTSDYIEITAVRAPYVDLVGPSIKSTMSGNTDYTISGTKATVYCNGSITYSAPSTSVSVNFPGVSVSTDVSGNIVYRYSVNTTFVFLV